MLEQAAASFEIVFVDDGSSDATLQGLRELHAEDTRVKAVSFSRNFGKEIAIAAALDHSRGAAVVLMDADLQHPPETIAAFVAKWREGFKNVYGVRRDRAGEPPLRTLFANLFYGLFDRFGETPLPRGAGDFRLLDRQAIDALSRMRERARFSKGLFAWIGFKSIGVPFEVEERASGRSKFNYAKLIRFALDGLDVLFVRAAEGVGRDRDHRLDLRSRHGGLLFLAHCVLWRGCARLRLADRLHRLSRRDADYFRWACSASISRSFSAR